jgi:protein-L-isoaspartate(D-aspartate) O-methyltransferase
MSAGRRASLGEVRKVYAQLMAKASQSDDPRLERIFELVPREAFLPPGPWQIMVDQHYVQTPSADPAYLYQNALVAIDAAKGINNGEPFLHAAWIGAVAPKAGETICHIGVGTGYYTALLSMLALPGGTVHAFEIDVDLARRARVHLKPFEIVSVTQGDATQLPLPPSDLIYVNAGVVAPPISWLRALRPDGRMIFPWRPSAKVAITMLITRSGLGFEARPLMPAWFIPCVGASNADDCTKVPTGREARAVRSVRLLDDQLPDETAVAVYKDIWFSAGELASKR